MTSVASNSETERHGVRNWGAATWLQLSVVIFASGLLLLPKTNPQIATLKVIFVSIVLEAFPFMLIGALVSGMIEVLVSKEKIASVLPEGKLYAVFLAAGLGVVFPVCECAVVPVVRRLVRKGVPFSAAVAFLLGGPIVNPIVFASTAAAYGFSWNVPIMRTVYGYAVAVVIGLIMGFVCNKRSALLPIHIQEHFPMHDKGCQAVGPHRKTHKAEQALVHAAKDFMDVAGFLVIGGFVAALIQSAVDRNAFLLVGSRPSLSIVVMMALAVVLNLCSEADAFVAASFRLLVPMSAQMAFMVLGPMLDLKLVFMYSTLFRKRTILILASLTALAVLIAMLSQGLLATLTTVVF